MAGARVGIAYANKEIIKLYNKVKPPYNISELNQQAAITALENYQAYSTILARIISEKKRLIKELQKIKLIKKIYPSDANFLLVEVGNANKLYSDLISKKIITRNRNVQVSNCLRITVGTPEENDNLLNALNTLA